DAAVATARRWFDGLGLTVEELPVRTRIQAASAVTAARAASGALFYLCGGDPGVVPKVLAGTSTWSAIVEAWRGGAALAGSSAGAMALAEWTLIRGRVPGDADRQPRPALGLVRGVAVIPHFETFGHRWLPSTQGPSGLAGATLLGIDERSAAIWVDGRWLALGAGGVTIMRAGEEVRFEPGQEIDGLPAPRQSDATASPGT
ncbi:MAG: Type 1 glutamine amidotransferase-like domain-containing protein, partial [Chloroflexi bacterium]|nr:Type 1 glutamine amidotransferase-like domain-containing protein [Chloroflexota bacterium]